MPGALLLERRVLRTELTSTFTQCQDGRTRLSKVFCGIDWAENHHDIALVDQDGIQLAKLRISDDSAGFHALLELLARHGDSPEAPIPVAIETPRGLLVASLRATGRKIYAINPLAAARYRDRSSVARAKSDAADARVLANILRTDMAAHRPLPADSELAQSVAVLARAHQDAVWDKTQMVNRLRSHLREYYPAALSAFHGSGTLGLDSAHARAVLAAAPTPATAARFTHSQLRALLKRAGRLRRGIEAEAERLREIFRRDHLHQLPQVEQAMGKQTQALIQQLDAACRSVDPRGSHRRSVPRPPGRGDHHQLSRPVDHVRSPRPGRGRRRSRTVRGCPGLEGIRRRGPRDSGLRPQPRRGRQSRQESAPGRRWLHVGFRRTANTGAP